MIQRSVAGLLRGLRGEHPVETPRRDAEAPPRSAPSLAELGSVLKIRHLSTIDVFRDLEPEMLEWLASHTTMVTARRGQLMYMPGETSEALFLLKTGRIRIYRLTADGKKLVLSTLEPHTFFGDMPLAGQQMYGTYAEAIDDCLVCVLGRSDLERLIQTRPLVAIRLLEVVGRRLLEAEAVIEDFAFKSVPARLAALLLRLPAGGDGRELIGYTHQDLADMIGTYRETTTQALDDFQRHGVVELGRKKIRIVDRDGLEVAAAR